MARTIRAMIAIAIMVSFSMSVFSSGLAASGDVPRIAVVKQATRDGQVISIASIGDSITYTYQVRNTGNVPLTDVTVTDDRLGTVSCPQTILSADDQVAGSGSDEMVCTASHTVTAGERTDADGPALSNVATAIGTAPSGSVVSATASATITVSPLALSVIATSDGVTPVTTVPVYQATIFVYQVTNDGSDTLTNVTVDDYRSPYDGPVCGIVSLAPGETHTCTRTRDLTFDLYTTIHPIGDGAYAGTFRDDARAAGQLSSGDTVNAADRVSVDVVMHPALELDFQATDGVNEITAAYVGETIHYRVVAVRNVGDVRIEGSAVYVNGQGGCGLAQGYLNPGQSGSCVNGGGFTHVVTAADLTDGDGPLQTTEARVETVLHGALITATDDATVTVSSDVPRIAVVKQATRDGQVISIASIGDSITYTYQVRNTGNVPLTDVTVTDDRLGTVSCPQTILSADDQVAGSGSDEMVCTASHTVTAGERTDADGPALSNVATAIGTAPSGSVVSATASATITVSPLALSVIATSDGVTPVTTVPVYQATIFVYQVTNDGSDTLTNVTVDDYRSPYDGPVCGIVSLAPGETHTCTRTRDLTFDLYTTIHPIGDGAYAGTFRDDARAAGQLSSGDTVNAADRVSVDVVMHPALELDFQATDGVNEITAAYVGETIHYRVVAVRNVGDVRIEGSAVYVNGQGGCGLAQGYLNPGQSGSCVNGGGFTHVVTAADLTDGDGPLQTTEARVETVLHGALITATDDATVTVSSDVPRIAVVKQATRDGQVISIASIGDSITYTYQVRNTGNVPLTDVTVTDDRLGTVSCPQTILSADDQVAGSGSDEMVCTASHTVTAGERTDADGPALSNVATAIGTAPSGSVVSATASATITVSPLALSVIATSDGVTPVTTVPVYQATIFVYQVTNDGSDTLTNVTVDDYRSPYDGPVCGIVSLAPGETHTCTRTRDLTFDLYTTIHPIGDGAYAGTFRDDARAAGQLSSGDTVNAADRVSVDVVMHPALELDFQATDGVNEITAAYVGETIHYRVVAVRNVGDVRIEGSAVYVNGQGGCGLAQGYLNPGQSGSCVNGGGFTHVVTAADLTDGDGPLQTTEARVETVLHGALITATDDATVTIASLDANVHPDDSTPPTTTASTRNADGTSYLPGSWTSQDVTVTLIAQDNSGGSGVNTTYYGIDNATQQVYHSPFVVSGDGTHNVIYWSIDNDGNIERANSLQIRITPLAITTQSPLPDGTIGVQYSVTMQATGGTQPYTWSISAGQLPDGLSIDPSTGVISGTPTTAGTFGFTVQVTDSSQITATKQFTFAGPPATGTGGSGYDQPVSLPAPPGSPTPDQPADCASGSYALAPGSTLPDGLTLDPNTGVIGGTPTDGGTYTFTVQCTTTTNETAQADFTIIINNPAPVLSSIDPSSTDGGGTGVALDVLGSGFVQSSSILWNGTALSTTYVSASELTATIPTADIASPGTANITVSNPAPGGGTSNTLTFTINNPAPANNVQLNVEDSQGNPVSNAVVTYTRRYTYNLGLTSADGIVNGNLPAGTYTFHVSYHGTSADYGPVDVTTDSVTTHAFQTVNAQVYLQTCSGSGLASGAVRYQASGGYWYYFGGTIATPTDANGVVSWEIFPGTYLLEMDYGGASSQATVDVGSPYTFTTTAVTLLNPGTITYTAPNGYTYAFNGPAMQLLPATYTFRTGGTSFDLEVSGCSYSGGNLRLVDHNGNGLAGGTASYYLGGWHTIPGETDANGNLVFAAPNSSGLSVAMVHQGERQQLNDAELLSSSFTFQTVLTTIKLEDHASDPLDTGTASYYAGIWHTIGDTSNGQVQLEMLPGSYSFAMVYAGTRQQLNHQNIGANAAVVFQTVLTTIKLEDHTGNPLDTGTASYYAGSWHTIGDTSNGQVQLEMLPGSYSFAMDYLGSREQLNGQNNGNDVVFQTGQVHSDGGTATSYYAGAWHAFTQNMELLPGTYTFAFSDQGNTRYAIMAGIENDIH